VDRGIKVADDKDFHVGLPSAVSENYQDHSHAEDYHGQPYSSPE
jgi:hypothetical protein